MRNIKLVIEYDGTKFAGWQTQRKTPACRQAGQVTRRKSQVTIQETIENALQGILQKKVKVIASGRTDAGVHALGQVANFKTDTKIPALNLKRALNSYLPADIVIKSAEDEGPDFHSRFDAKSKKYRYDILNRAYPPALLKNRVYFYYYPLDIELMQKASRSLLGRHDFKAFQASGRPVEDAVRTIKKIRISRKNDLISIEIEADGFLYNMVRNIVGTLIEIGRGKFPSGSLKKIMWSKNRSLAGPTVPACGLYLSEVKY
jgi:tRNA pseudouridine38-40 synthase